ncbi:MULTISPECIES: AI-2E family transporter [unclassified Acinetobacter]|uniref:AI-2E family transporter n=1 Tax=unclassified Acinetobacter TaxID=196816 RepID=UPI00211EEE45|nr:MULTISPECIES: AI-2E family transporter [unclassified Acinetobacter]
MDHKNNKLAQDFESSPSGQKQGLQDLNASKQMPPADLHKVIRITAGFIICSLLIAALYLGKDIFIPLALAILLAFLVDPLVMKLRGWGLPQMPSIFIVVGLALAILSGAASYLGYQLGQLSQELPQYHGTIQKKMDSIRQFARGPSVWDGAKTTIDTVENSIDDVVPEEKNPKVQQVEVVGQQQTTAEAVMAWSERVLNPLATAGIVFLFVILILVNRKDLHDRFLKLLGGNLNIGTDALDEAANRIGKYLRMQLMVNVTYGIPMALGLWFIGVPAAIMWGMVAIVMRFVPYVGPMISAIFPIALAFAVDPTWNMVLWTVGLILLLELVSNNIIEPWLYGESTGLSTLAIILAAMFWTAVWGPIGLILSTPLTACLLVLSSYVPSLGFIKTLIGSTPALAPHERFYQRLVADDVQDAVDVAQNFIAEKLPKEAKDEIKARRVNAFYAKVAIPAIRIFSRGHNTEASAEHRLRLHQGLKLFNHSFQRAYPVAQQDQKTEVFCIGARWEIDVQVSAMLAHGLSLSGIPAQAFSDVLIQNQHQSIDDIQADIQIVCISIFHTAPEAQIRLLSHVFKAQFPDKKLIFALWSCDEVKQLDAIKENFTVDAVVNNMNDLLLTIEAFQLKQGESWLDEPDPSVEAQRLKALEELNVLDERNLPIFEQYIEEARQAFDVKYAQISWVKQDWVYTPGSPLAEATEQPMQVRQSKQDSICSHLVYQNERLIIEDLQRDPRFAHLPELMHNRIRFYAGVALRDRNGVALGSFCVLDRQPNQMTDDDMSLLKGLAADLMNTLSDENVKRKKCEEIQQLNDSSS